MTPTPIHDTLARYVASKDAPGRVHVVGWAACDGQVFSMVCTHFAARFIPTHLQSETAKLAQLAERIAADYRRTFDGLAHTPDITHGVEVFGAELARKEAA